MVNDAFLGVVQSVSDPCQRCQGIHAELDDGLQWNLLYGGMIPVIAYLDQDNELVGFDFWGTERRTKVVNRFFNNVVGEVNVQVFENFPC